MNIIEKLLYKLFGITYVPDVSAGDKQAIRDLQNMTNEELNDIGVRRSDIRSRVMGTMGDL